MVDWVIPTVTDLQSPEALLLNISSGAAQQYCNFPLFSPAILPAGFKMMEQTLRRECIPGRNEQMTGRSPWSNANSSAYRMILSDGIRQIRLKQFLYDWAPAAADQPCLWQSKTEFKPLSNGFIVWFGKDYKKRVGAYTTAFRTSCEVSVEQGEFTHAELYKFVDSLKPVSSQALKIINQQPFYKLSYWARFACGSVNVPYGLWYYRRLDVNEKRIWNANVENITHIITRLNLAGMVRFGYHVDSICHFNKVGGDEVHLLFSTHDKNSSQLHLFIDKSQKSILIPPKQEKHPCQTETIEFGKFTIYLAYVSSDYGPFEAIWQGDGYRGMLLCTSHSQVSKGDFIKTLTGLINHA